MSVPNPAPSSPYLATAPVIRPEVASSTLHVLIASLLRAAGFDAADGDVILEIERMTLELLCGIAEGSTQYAALANRTHVAPQDILLASLDEGLDVRALKSVVAASRQEHASVSFPPFEVLPPPSPISFTFLPSDPLTDSSFLSSTSSLEPSISDTHAHSPSLILLERRAASSYIANSSYPHPPPKIPKSTLATHVARLPAYAHPFAPALPPAHSFRYTLQKKRKPTGKPPTVQEMEARLASTRLVEAELGRLIERTTMAAAEPRKGGAKRVKREDGGGGGSEDDDEEDEIGLVNYRRAGRIVG